MTNFFRARRPRARSGLMACDRGATAIEYGLILAMIAVTIIGSVTLVADKTINMWTNVANAVNAH